MAIAPYRLQITERSFASCSLRIGPEITYRFEPRIIGFSHSREGGNPANLTSDCEKLGTRLRGHDVVGNREPDSCPFLSDTTACRYFGCIDRLREMFGR
jgi:hypothetical protein